MNKISKIFIFVLFGLFFLINVEGALSELPRVELRQDQNKGQLRVLFDSREVFVYQYIGWLDLPHIWPMRSPSGKNLLVQQTEPYPHHRAFYFADAVRLNGGREISIYNALYTGQKIGKNAYGPPFRDCIRHVEFTRLEEEGNRAFIEAELVWIMDGEKPVLDEHRHLAVCALGNGEYVLDVKLKLTAAYGDVQFVSDEVHYAWPFLRLHPQFSGEKGGTITADSGARGQEATNLKFAEWIDYSNTVEGVTEGVAVFQWPDGSKHRWLTREYGLVGPRRPDDLSGKPFTLPKDDSITQRVGILVHRGNVKRGRVARRYKQYIGEKWSANTPAGQ
jgi:hypothetical protein